MRASTDPSLASFLRAHIADVVQVWERRVLALGKARRLPRPLLVNHVPDMLARVVQLLESGAQADDVRWRAAEHARERVREGFTIDDVLLEVALLRDATLDVRGDASVLTGDQAVLLVQAFDPVVAEVVRQYA